jgi:AcrR family transcriptional regulator
MSQSSDIAKTGRRVPRQERAERTVAAVLDAAAAEIAEVGYESATMTAIADRAGASIGAVYQYFPNKAALVEALRTQYGAIMHGMWRPLIADAGALAIPELVDRIFGVFIDFIDGHPAYFPLLNAPVSRGKDQRARARNRLRLREEFAAAFGQKQPALTSEEALRVARVAVEMVKAINPLYGDVTPKERRAVIAELKLALVAYLRERLAPPGSP